MKPSQGALGSSNRPTHIFGGRTSRLQVTEMYLCAGEVVIPWWCFLKYHLLPALSDPLVALACVTLVTRACHPLVTLGVSDVCLAWYLTLFVQHLLCQTQFVSHLLCNTVCVNMHGSGWKRQGAFFLYQHTHCGDLLRVRTRDLPNHTV